MSLDLEGIKAANRPPHGPADRTVSALVAEVERLTADYEGACKLVAQMHAAAIGGKVGDGPRLGVLEDVVAVQRALAESEARVRYHKNLEDGYASQFIDRVTKLDAAQRALAAAQADAARLRAAARNFMRSQAPATASVYERSELEAALAAPAGDEALRDFGLRVADACFAQASRGPVVDGLAAVDAVLRGVR